MAQVFLDPSGSSSRRPDNLDPRNAFDRDFLETFSRREPAPATPEADHTGPWRVTRLYGAGDPRWACIAAGEPPPRFQLREPDVAFLTSAGLTLVDRPSRFRFQVDAAGTLHLMQDGHSVGTARRESDQLPLILTALHNLRVQPEALAHFLLAVPDEVLRRCGVVLGERAGGRGCLDDAVARARRTEPGPDSPSARPPRSACVVRLTLDRSPAGTTAPRLNRPFPGCNDRSGRGRPALPRRAPLG